MLRYKVTETKDIQHRRVANSDITEDLQATIIMQFDKKGNDEINSTYTYEPSVAYENAFITKEFKLDEQRLWILNNSYEYCKPLTQMAKTKEFKLDEQRLWILNNSYEYCKPLTQMAK
ncbi:hypothetical protein E5288_WYG014122 [Bos mutus]|uniref:Uncharacterized protein n=1 Tax=Bos mutus TaxID=72004 RepID=A0A6B0S0J0_9CETA|nr:hypothetical protein [Bos mutus]